VSAPLKLPEPDDFGADEDVGYGDREPNSSVGYTGPPPDDLTVRKLGQAFASLVGFTLAAATARAYWGLRSVGRRRH
jgi:hypothetical protein